MVFECYGCDRDYEIGLPEIAAGDLMTRHLGKKRFPTHCPECGSVVAPRDISSEDLPGWFRLFSQCPNAMCCVQESNCYRPECERLVFYPGCLTFLWRVGHEINLGFKQFFNQKSDHK